MATISNDHLWALKYWFGHAVRHCGTRTYNRQAALLDRYLPQIPDLDQEEYMEYELNDARGDLKLAMRLRRWRDAVRSQNYDDMTFRYEKIIGHVDELMRRARLDEHKILAGLDEEGKKQRYLELAQEN